MTSSELSTFFPKHSCYLLRFYNRIEKSDFNWVLWWKILLLKLSSFGIFRNLLHTNMEGSNLIQCYWIKKDGLFFFRDLIFYWQIAIITALQPNRISSYFRRKIKEDCLFLQTFATRFFFTIQSILLKLSKVRRERLQTQLKMVQKLYLVLQIK